MFLLHMKCFRDLNDVHNLNWFPCIAWWEGGQPRTVKLIVKVKSGRFDFSFRGALKF